MSAVRFRPRPPSSLCTTRFPEAADPTHHGNRTAQKRGSMTNATHGIRLAGRLRRSLRHPACPAHSASQSPRPQSRDNAHVNTAPRVSHDVRGRNPSALQVNPPCPDLSTPGQRPCSMSLVPQSLASQHTTSAIHGRLHGCKESICTTSIRSACWRIPTAAITPTADNPSPHTR